MYKTALGILTLIPLISFASENTVQLGFAAAAYQAHVEGKIRAENQKDRDGRAIIARQEIDCRGRADHAACPRCLEFDRNQPGLARHYKNLFAKLPQMPHDLIVKLLQGDKDWMQHCAYSDCRLVDEADVKMSSCEPKPLCVAISISDRDNEIYTSFVAAYRYRCVALHKKALAIQLDQQKHIPGFPAELNQIVAGYGAGAPVGVAAGQAISLMTALGLHPERGMVSDGLDGDIELDLKRALLHSADGIRPDAYERIHLAHNRITRISKSDFSHQAFSAATLDLSHNQIAEIEDGAFGVIFSKKEDLTSSFRTLQLSHNRLTKVTVGMLRPEEMNVLQELNLSCNNISEIEPGALRQLEGLKRVDLSGNQLTQVPEELFEMESLTQVCLNHNPLTPAARKRALELHAWLQRDRGTWATLKRWVNKTFAAE